MGVGLAIPTCPMAPVPLNPPLAPVPWYHLHQMLAFAQEPQGLEAVTEALVGAVMEALVGAVTEAAMILLLPNHQYSNNNKC